MAFQWRGDSVKLARLRQAESHIAATDYKVIKAAEELAAEKLEEMYPGAREEREAIREEIRRLMGEEAPYQNAVE